MWRIIIGITAVLLQSATVFSTSTLVTVNMTKVPYGTRWQTSQRITNTQRSSAYVYLDILEGKCYNPTMTIDTVVSGFEEDGDYINLYIDNTFLSKWYASSKQCIS